MKLASRNTLVRVSYVSEIPGRNQTSNDDNRIRMMADEPEAIIVGAGILGCALAVALGKQGRRVVLIERDLSEPDRIVGELLQPGGVRALRELGLADCLDGIDAIPEYGYQVIYKDEKVVIPYIGEDERTRQGRSFHHGRFIMRLRAAVQNVST